MVLQGIHQKGEHLLAFSSDDFVFLVGEGLLLEIPGPFLKEPTFLLIGLSAEASLFPI